MIKEEKLETGVKEDKDTEEEATKDGEREKTEEENRKKDQTESCNINLDIRRLRLSLTRAVPGQSKARSRLWYEAPQHD